MKKSLLFFATLLSFIGYSQTGPGFTVTNTNGSYAITCATPTLNFKANSNNNLTYVWNGPSSSQTGSNVNISIPGNYTVVGTDTSNISSNFIFTVVMNTFVPNSSISPSLATISCSLNSAVTFTGSTSTSNITHYFMSPYSATAIYYTSTALYAPFAPGTYTYVVKDNLNGCKTTKTFTISSIGSHPTFSIVSPQSFTLGCTSKSVAIVHIINAATSPTPGGAVSYTLIGPPTSTSYNTGSQSSYTLSTAGNWTVIVKDNSNSCESKVPFAILQNTTTPSISISASKQLLDCNTPTVNLLGLSSTANVSYIWSFLGTPGIVYSDTFNVHANFTAPTSTFTGNYTLTVKDMSSNCESHSVIPIYQNVFNPNAAISNGGVDSIPCILPPTLMLTNISSTGIPSNSGYPNNMPVIGLLWKGPSPLTSSANTSTYIASLAGIYTLTVKDLNNGCSVSTFKMIYDGCNKVGIPKNMINNHPITFFPNPNKGFFTVHSNNLSENSKIEIYNVLGVLIRTEDLNSEKTTINIEETSRGIYIIQVVENNKIIYTSKIIKE